MEDWQVAMLSAGVGFVLSQVGAYLQLARERKSHAAALQAQAAAESDRLQKQFNAQARESEAARRHAEVMGWRDRRVDAYREVSVRASLIAELAGEQAKAGEGSFLGPAKGPEKRLHDEVAALERAAQEVYLIADIDTRIAAEMLVASGSACRTAAFALSSSRALLKSAQDRRDAGEPISDDLIARFFERPLDVAEEEHRAATERWPEAASTFESARSKWAEQSRLGLGVPPD